MKLSTHPLIANGGTCTCGAPLPRRVHVLVDANPSKGIAIIECKCGRSHTAQMHDTTEGESDPAVTRRA